MTYDFCYECATYGNTCNQLVTLINFLELRPLIYDAIYAAWFMICAYVNQGDDNG